MRFVKLGLISIVGLFIVIFAISLLIPGEIRVSRAVNIIAPKDSIHDRLADLRHWKQWNALTNVAGVLNQQYAANTITSDELTVKLREARADSITTTWQQKEGRTIESGFNLHTVDNTTVVQWYFDFHLKWYPWEKFGSIIFDKQLGPPMEQSLAELKKLLEQAP
ncbi:SRPBCC family protein [Paraflavitalea pollutisoli]|uniref:SRPBCC family protein n=1 Tax=Paraflavitalea pollutisoli TaxID=3034143 RepID=UPI0023EAD38F|nr:SRPBCC family protein [Paraflavitalea sp. H1-2-19X]